MDFLIAFGSTFFGLFILFPILFGFARFFGVYAIVEEGTAHVYVLFGKVRAVLDAPGIYFLWFQLGLAGPIINILGKRYILDLRLDQAYLRSQPVNSEEGAPMGIGIWYEMFVSDPVSNRRRAVSTRAPGVRRRARYAMPGLSLTTTGADHVAPRLDDFTTSTRGDPPRMVV